MGSTIDSNQSGTVTLNSITAATVTVLQSRSNTQLPEFSRYLVLTVTKLTFSRDERCDDGTVSALII